ncbi:Male sterility, NAD-binding [Penicillium digitatum]|uniref:Fatty acyl-CoA reductase n=1 Tax=Penicillium digitatum TaxID=36651 RepID=A0A7T6XEK8_PENDI|nr:Male sterility, NAD-binding [Penicillium digitatum]
MIWDYFNGKTLFITGGTGFVGTALLCRLLSQSSPKRVYVLCWGGFDKAKIKWSDMLPSSTAQTLITDERITFLDGELGNTTTMTLSEETLQMLKRTVQIVFHAATSAQLHKTLPELAHTVLAPSICLTTYALKFPNLERFVFFSTAYANAHLWKAQESTDVSVDERIYPLGREEEDYYRIALEAWNAVQKTGSSEEYNAHDFPWPYAYAKHLAERLVLQKAGERNKMDKVLVIRPSVLGPADKFPFPGFATLHGAPSTACAAAYLLHAGRRIKLSTRCEKPHQESTIDEVPVDVVVDRTLVHVALGTSGCVHAVSGEQGRLSTEEWWCAVQKERRLPWNAKPSWTSDDWHSPNLHFVARRFKIIGTSFAFSQERTLRATEKLSAEEKKNLQLFADRSKPYSLHLRRHQIHHHAVEVAKKKKWPLCSAGLLCRKGRPVAHKT